MARTVSVSCVSCCEWWLVSLRLGIAIKTPLNRRYVNKLCPRAVEIPLFLFTTREVDPPKMKFFINSLFLQAGALASCGRNRKMINHPCTRAASSDAAFSFFQKFEIILTPFLCFSRQKGVYHDKNLCPHRQVRCHTPEQPCNLRHSHKARPQKESRRKDQIMIMATKTKKYRSDIVLKCRGCGRAIFYPSSSNRETIRCPYCLHDH